MGQFGLAWPVHWRHAASTVWSPPGPSFWLGNGHKSPLPRLTHVWSQGLTQEAEGTWMAGKSPKHGDHPAVDTPPRLGVGLAWASPLESTWRASPEQLVDVGLSLGWASILQDILGLAVFCLRDEPSGLKRQWPHFSPELAGPPGGPEGEREQGPHHLPHCGLGWACVGSGSPGGMRPVARG